LLARHLAAHRTRLTEESRARPLETAQPAQPPKLSPKEAHQSQAHLVDQQWRGRRACDQAEADQTTGL
jgi:hypothetical protein